jgi:nicotinamide-nucleotide amidase
VPAGLIAEHGAVSAEVARAMAEGARTRFGADIGLAFTGVAGPGGGSEQKPVGLVHWAVATEHTSEQQGRVFIGSRQDIRRRAVFAGLDLVRRSLTTG